MIIKHLIAQFLALNIPSGQYLVFGSGPMAVRDIRDAKDLDIAVSDDYYKELLKTYSENKPGNIVISENIEIWSASESRIDDFTGAIQRADIIDTISYLSLPDLIKWKTAMGRDKDIRDIELINSYFKNTKT